MSGEKQEARRTARRSAQLAGPNEWEMPGGAGSAYVPGPGGQPILLSRTPAEELQQQDHLVFLVRGAMRGSGSGLAELRDAARQFGSGTFRAPGAFQDAGAQEFGDVLQFIGRKTGKETAGPGTQGNIGTRNESGYQRTSHVGSPVG